MTHDTARAIVRSDSNRIVTLRVEDGTDEAEVYLSGDEARLLCAALSHAAGEADRYYECEIMLAWYRVTYDAAAELKTARKLAARFGAYLMCNCGRAKIGDDGRCPRCAEEDEP